MRPIMFSRVFPKYHPKAGKETFFMEKIWAGLAEMGFQDVVSSNLPKGINGNWQEYYNGSPKYHTIRAGQRWKEGDVFQPRIWQDLPYRSPQIDFTPLSIIRKKWKIEIHADDKFYIEEVYAGLFIKNNPIVRKLALNDGLLTEDLLDWFPNKKGFSGQIICWNSKIEY